MKPDLKKVFTNPRYFLALGFGSGLVPRAPGTFGTLAAIPFYLILAELPVLYYAGVVIVALAVGIIVCGSVAQELAVKDPAIIVWDEFVGLWIALFMLPEGWIWLLIGFAVFRFFDILKPWPVNYFDEKLSGGAGIMLDDVAAGLYTLLVIQLAAQSVRYLL